MEENWEVILGFENYEISDLGRCVNRTTGHVLTMQISTGNSPTYFLIRNNKAHARSVRLLVANAFLPRDDRWAQDPEVADTPICLDYDPHNCRVENLRWRPRWFAVKYSRQADMIDWPAFQVPVVNVTTGESYNSIVEACLTEGLLFRDVYDCCGLMKGGVIPTGAKFRFLGEERDDFYS